MPASVSVDHERHYVRLVMSDPLAVHQLTDAHDDVVTAGAWGYSALVLATSLTHAPTTAEVRDVVEHVGQLAASLGPRGPVAIVAARDAVYGMARMFSMLNETLEHNVEVFRDEPTALAWLSTQPTSRPSVNTADIADTVPPRPGAACPRCGSHRVVPTETSTAGDTADVCCPCGTRP